MQQVRAESPAAASFGSNNVACRLVHDGRPAIVRLPEIHSIDDGPGKPASIDLFIGRRPVMAFGNSDGDFEMLEWTTAGPGPRFRLIVQHTDAEREYAYDRGSHFGRLERALDEAPKRGWTVADMKGDWRKVFAFERGACPAAHTEAIPRAHEPLLPTRRADT